MTLKSETSFVINERDDTRKSIKKIGSSQEKSRSRSKGKSNQTKKVESAGRNSQTRPLSRGVGTVPNSNKLTSRGSNVLNTSNTQLESKPRPPSSSHARKF